MEPDIIGAQEELALAEIIEKIIFRRCNRLVNDLADLEPNSPERNRLQEQYTPVLHFANQAQLVKQEAERKMLAVLATMNPAPIFEALTRLDLPFADDPITTIIDNNIRTLTRETVQEWIVEELTRIREAANDPQR